MVPVIAIPYHPGSNGLIDAKREIEATGMTALPLYFHIGNQERLQRNAELLKQADGAVLPGGFPYEDRLGFGRVPSKMKPFAEAMRYVVDSGKPVIAFCAGNQIGNAMSLAFPEGSDYKVYLLDNIGDRDSGLAWTGFYDKKIHTKLTCDPQRNAFTSKYQKFETIPDIISHGGGRFWADNNTLQYILENGLVVTRYCDAKGDISDNFPTNPNGSMLNIESITNIRGNLKIGMAHNERRLNALIRGRNNNVFESMKRYIEDSCPDLSSQARDQQGIVSSVKHFPYCSQQLDTSRTTDVYIEMLTDDNEQMTAELFLGDVDLVRRRLLRIELDEENIGDSESVVEILAKMDFFSGIMLKKDLPTIAAPGGQVSRYEVVDPKTMDREFRSQEAIVPGFPSIHTRVDLPNPAGYDVMKMMERHRILRGVVTNVHAGDAWFFRNDNDKQRVLEELLG